MFFKKKLWKKIKIECKLLKKIQSWLNSNNQNDSFWYVQILHKYT